MSAVFSGKTAVVTGAASGIGYALSVMLVRQGARVYALDISLDGLQRLNEACAGKLSIARVDVTHAAELEACLDQVVAQHGRLDYLFNNAGTLLGGNFEDMSPATWKRIVDINLWGVIYGAQKGYQLMLHQRSGHIINTASTAGLMPVAQSTAYAMTKHAVVGLSTSLREEAIEHGIRVSVVIPGVIDTGIFKAATNLSGYNYDAEISKQPYGRMNPLQAAEAILDGVARNQAYIIFPRYNRVICWLYRFSPELGAWLLRKGRERNKTPATH